jgi:hypothetical protein
MADLPNPGNDWQERLDMARSVPDVVDACDEFISRFTPAELHELPPGCQPPERLDAAAISTYAVDLVRAELAPGSGVANPLLRTFALFFGDAAACIARIAMARGRQDGWAYVAWRK